MIGRILKLAIFLATPAWGVEHGGYIEVAPMRTVLGSPIVRAEVPVLPALSVGVSHDEWTKPSKRQGMEDEFRAWHAEGFFYLPLRELEGQIFVGGGLGWHRSQQGGQAYAATRTWEGRRSEDEFDLWHWRLDEYTLAQTIGYRVVMGRYTTASLRARMEQTLYRNDRLYQDHVVSPDVELPGPVTTSFRKQIALYVGVLLP